MKVNKNAFKDKALRVPVVWANRTCPALVIEKPNRWGFELKNAIRQIAKHFPEYHLPIEPTWTGRNDAGEEILVNTLGRWAFGVPGFRGRLMFEGGELRRIVVYYPPESPPELISMLEKAIRLLP